MYDLSKQPKWVQDEVAGLERTIKSQDKALARLLTNKITSPDKALARLLTNKITSPYEVPVGTVGIGTNHEAIQLVPERTPITFPVEREHITVQGGARGEVIIHASAGELVVRPRVSNEVIVSIREAP